MNKLKSRAAADVGEIYLTSGQVCERLQVSKKHLYALIRSGVLPAYRVGDEGRHLRFRSPDVEACLKRVEPDVELGSEEDGS